MTITVWNAHAARQEDDLGALEPGTRADLVALSADVFRCRESRTKDIVPVLTMVGGAVAFTRDGGGGVGLWRG